MKKDSRNHAKSTILLKCTVKTIKKAIQWKHDEIGTYTRN